MKNYIYYLLLLALSISCTANKKGIDKTEKQTDQLVYTHVSGENLKSDSTLWGMKIDFVKPDNAGAMEAVLKERMREFMVEGKRWYDLRLAGDEYVLEHTTAEATRLLWPIDKNTLTNNSALKQTPGYESSGGK